MMHSGRNQITWLFRSTKMRVVLVLLAVLACGLALPKYQGNEQHEDIRQQHVFDILKYINNPMYQKDFLQVAENFNLESNAEHYKTDAYQNFLNYFHHDRFLNKGEIFSIFNEEHMKQAKALFKLFYHSESYEMFHTTAVWARHHLNEGLFLYSYCVAITHRSDTQDLVLPPVYELFPHYFYNSEVLQEAYKLKMTHYQHGKQQEHFTIHANYSGFYLNLDPEQSLSYYLEDVGINAFYFYYNIHKPYWMKSEEFHLNHNRGESFYYTHKQLYARYHLERLSHGLGDVEYFNWDLPFKTGYYPSLNYPNGLPFPERPHFANLREYLHYYGQKLCDRSEYAFDYTYVQTYEDRIREAIDSGFIHDHEGNTHQIYSEEGINILGNIIEGNADSPNYQYYGSFVNIARHLLGYSKHPLNHHKLAPSALEHYSTSMRDPAFYSIFKKVFILIDHFKQNMPHYEEKHLHQNGLKIDNVEIDQLVTYYDNFLSDITNGLFVTPEEYEQDSFRVKVHQYRLNHKNFNYKVHVKAEKETKVAVKVFIGPKYDEHGRSLRLSQIHDKVFQIDQFVLDLKVGDNVITRNSADCYWFRKDYPSFHDDSGNEKLFMQYGLPLRMKLPRGSEEGTSFQVYVIVYPYDQTKKSDHQREVDGLVLDNYIPVDTYPLGYPFDRPTEHEDVYHVPNAFVKHVKIYHQVNQKILHGDAYDSSSEDQEDVDVYQQRGDHNNYNVYHHILEDDEKHNSLYLRKNNVNTNKYLTDGVRSFLKDLTKKYPGQVYAPSYKNYQAAKHPVVKSAQYNDAKYNTYGNDQIQYKKQNVYDEDQVHDKFMKKDNNQKYSVYGDDQAHDNYQMHFGTNGQYKKQYNSDEDQSYGQYQKHDDIEGLGYNYQGKYGYDNNQYTDKYHSKSYDTKYNSYQGVGAVNRGYGDNYQALKYQTDGEEHHWPITHHY